MLRSDLLCVRRSAYGAMLCAAQEEEGTTTTTFRNSKSLMHELLANGVHSSDHVVARASLLLLVALIPTTFSSNNNHTYRSFVPFLPHLQVLALKPDFFFKDDEGVLPRQVRELCEAVAAAAHSNKTLELILKSQQLFHKVEDVRRDAAKTLRIELSLKCENEDYVDDPIGTLPSLSSSAVRAAMDVVPSDLKRKATKSDLLRLSEMLNAEEDGKESKEQHTYLKRYRGTVTRRLHDAAAEQLICVVSSGITDGVRLHFASSVFFQPIHPPNHRQVLRASDEIRDSVLKSCMRSLHIALQEKTRNRDTNARVTTRMRLLEVVLTHTRLPTMSQCDEIVRLGMRGLFHSAVTARASSAAMLARLAFSKDIWFVDKAQQQQDDVLVISQAVRETFNLSPSAGIPVLVAQIYEGDGEATISESDLGNMIRYRRENNASIAQMVRESVQKLASRTHWHSFLHDISCLHRRWVARSVNVSEFFLKSGGDAVMRRFFQVAPVTVADERLLCAVLELALDWNIMSSQMESRLPALSTISVGSPTATMTEKLRRCVRALELLCHTNVKKKDDKVSDTIQIILTRCDILEKASSKNNKHWVDRIRVEALRCLRRHRQDPKVLPCLVSLLARFSSDRDSYASFGKSRGIMKESLRCVHAFIRGRKDISVDMFLHRKTGLMWCLSFVNDRETSVRGGWNVMLENISLSPSLFSTQQLQQQQ